MLIFFLNTRVFRGAEFNFRLHHPLSKVELIMGDTASFPQSQLLSNMLLERKEIARLKHQHAKRAGLQPPMCVQFWVSSEPDYVQSSLSY